MNIIAKRIEYFNESVVIQFIYENEEDYHIGSFDILKFGIYDFKQRIDIIFDEITPIVCDHTLTFKLCDRIRSYFLSTGAEFAQIYIDCYKKELPNNEETSSYGIARHPFVVQRCFILNKSFAQQYFCNFSKVMRLYFSKTGLLSIDAKDNSFVKDEEILFLKDYIIEKNHLTINVPINQEVIEDCEILIARATDYNNIYTDIVENYISRFHTKIDDDTICVKWEDLANIRDINSTWFSIQVRLTFKENQPPVRLLMGDCHDRNGYAIYNLYRQGLKVETFVSNEVYEMHNTMSNIGVLFAVSMKHSILIYPLCSIRLIDLQIINNTVVLLTDCQGHIGKCEGIILIDALGNYQVFEYDCVSNGVMLSSIRNIARYSFLSQDIYRVFVLSYIDNKKWLIPIAVKEDDGRQFDSVIFQEENGYKYEFKLGLCNELRLEFRLPNFLSLNNRVNCDYHKSLSGVWDVLPESRGEFRVSTVVIDDKLFFYPEIKGVGKVIEEFRLIIAPNKIKDRRDFLPVEYYESTEDYYAIVLNQVEQDYISKNNICRLYVYFKTGYDDYFMPIVGIDKKHKINNKTFFDRRDYFLPSACYTIVNNIEYELQIYYSFQGQLSIRQVKTEDKFKGQMSAQIEDVSITDGILKVDAKANKLLCGKYGGICLAYRARTNEDIFNTISRNISIVENDMDIDLTAYVDLRELPVDGATWDIRLVYSVNEKDYYINLYQKDETLRMKFRNPYNKDEYVFENGMIVFPYCTFGNTVAILRREYYEEYDSVEFRLQESRAIELYEKNRAFYDRQNAILIFEKFGTCSDNAYHLFKYCMDHDCEAKMSCHIYYIIGKDSADYKNVSMYEKNLLEFGSLQHQIYLLAARLYISSDTNSHAYIFRAKDSYIVQEVRNKKYIFIDHGIAALKNGSYIYGKGKQGEPTWYTVASDFQKGLIHKYYGLRNEQIKVTGLARWDALEDKSTEKHKILIAPTWRRSLEDVSYGTFYNSSFCQKYLELLGNQKFHEILKRYDIECVFYVHLKFIQYLDNLKESGNDIIGSAIHIYSFDDISINRLYMECSMMITDYSSVAFDTLWQDKPVIFYQFDMDDFDEMWGSMIDMDRDLPGDRISNLDDLLETIENYAESNFLIKRRYLEKAKRYFKYVDHNNCERIWNVVESVWHKVSYVDIEASNTELREYVHPYILAADEGRVGLKTILMMITRWFRYKIIRTIKHSL